MVGWATGSALIRNAGFMTNASPLPLVFSVFRGTEPFSSSYAIEVKRQDGGVSIYGITPASYSKLQGPYNYRNVFGAAFAFGARLESPKERVLFSDVMNYAFVVQTSLLDALGVKDPSPRGIVIVQTSRARGIPGTWRVNMQGEKE